MKKIAILLSVFFIGFSHAQKPTDQNIQVKKQSKKSFKADPDARVFVVKEQPKASPNRKSVMTKEEALKNKKGFKRVHMALNKKRKIEKRKERKTLRAQNKALNKYIKEGEKQQKKIKKESQKARKSD